jgi:hypothetical protein
MGGKKTSSIALLDPAIKAEVDRAIREDRATIADIVALIKGMGADASKSAVGRYKQSAEKQMETYRQAQEVAKVWVQQIGDAPEGDVGRLVVELVRMLAFRSVSAMGDAEEPLGPEDLMFLSKAMKDLASADKTAVDREINRQALQRQVKAAAESVTKVAKQNGLTAEAVQTIRAQILGIKAK